jgi:Integrase core domain
LLTAVKDLYSCEIVGWAMDSRMTKVLVMDALCAAYWRKKPQVGLIHHSDRGSQYCSVAYRALQASLWYDTSMSRKGNCWEVTLQAFERSSKLASRGDGKLLWYVENGEPTPLPFCNTGAGTARGL